MQDLSVLWSTRKFKIILYEDFTSSEVCNFLFIRWLKRKFQYIFIFHVFIWRNIWENRFYMGIFQLYSFDLENFNLRLVLNYILEKNLSDSLLHRLCFSRLRFNSDDITIFREPFGFFCMVLKFLTHLKVNLSTNMHFNWTLRTYYWSNSNNNQIIDTWIFF